MSGTAPVVRLTAALAAGIGLGLIGAPSWSAPLVLLLGALAPILASERATGAFHRSRPLHRTTRARVEASLVVAFAAGIVAGSTERGGACDPGEWVGPIEAVGYFETRPRSGAAPFHAEGLCVALTAVVGAGSGGGRGEVPAGRLVRLSGHVVEGRFRPWIRVRTVEPVAPSTGGAERERVDAAGDAVGAAAEGVDAGLLRLRLVRWREAVLDRVYLVHGPSAGMVAALVLARREGLDHEVRDAFAAAGIAHLLAISGFHVGVVWGLVLSLLRAFGLRRRRAELSAITIVWAYVILIGIPDAAARAALLLTMVAAGRLSDRPPTRWGGLATAGLILLVSDPGRLASAGFQLSFAGAAGLTAWAGPWTRSFEAVLRAPCTTLFGRPPPTGPISALLAGCAATLATLPIVAWHFERVSVVGVPVTLAATPLVTLALPGALASLLVSVVSLPAARFVAGGTGVLLDALSALATWSASLPGATTWIDRPAVVAALVGVLLGLRLARKPGVGARTRRVLTVSWALVGVLCVPVAQTLRSFGTLELLMIDVGQGDALLLRSPAGRAILIDAGRPPDGDPRAHPVVRALRRAGVERLEWLVFTHADADHFGGGEAVLDQVDVARVLDPALAVEKPGYLSLLQSAAGGGIPWMRGRAGDRLDLDGVEIEVLHPSDSVAAAAAAGPGAVDANRASLILRVRWNGFSAVVTGDAYVDAERAVAGTVGDVDVLRVGHHGSRTSTAVEFLERVRPEWALISAGARNRYGHPAPDVVRRLEAAGTRIARTDQDGSVLVRVRRSGRFEVETRR